MEPIVEGKEAHAPLEGVTVVEFAGIGPGPFCGMLLADLGATVIRVDRPPTWVGDPPEAVVRAYRTDVMGRSKRSIGLDLKDPASRPVLEALFRKADVILEGFRPDVMERLGLGPEEAHRINPALVYARMTGWGQSGPLAPRAGHDLNYVSLSGVLSMIGSAGGPPVIPLNLVGDFGGGGMYMAFAISSALLAARSTGRGSVIDTAMAEGAAKLATMIFGLRESGAWEDERGVNLLDGGAPFYSVYRCADGGYFGVAALEPQFYAEMVSRLQLQSDAAFSDQNDRSRWPAMRERLAAVFSSASVSHFESLFEGLDACSFPVYTVEQAMAHPHNRARGAFVEVEGVAQPAPGPLFDGRRPSEPTAPPYPDEHRRAVMEFLGIA